MSTWNDDVQSLRAFHERPEELDVDDDFDALLNAPIIGSPLPRPASLEAAAAAAAAVGDAA